MKTRYCRREECGKAIDPEKRSDAIYCSPECGWIVRNEKKKKANAEKKLKQKPINENIKIIRDLYERGIDVISHQNLTGIGFITEMYTRIGKVDHASGSSEFIYDDFSLVLNNDNMINIKKIT